MEQQGLRPNEFCRRPEELLQHLRAQAPSAPTPDPKCSEQSPCRLKLFCGENAFPAQFKTAQVEIEGKTTYRLGNGKETTDPREAQVKLWARDHQDSKDQTASLMVPHLFMPTMSDVPTDKRESYKTVGVIEKILDQLPKTPLRTIPEVIKALSQYVAGYSEDIDMAALWQVQMSNYRKILLTKHSSVGTKGAGVPNPPTASDEDVVTWMTSWIPERETKLKKRVQEEISKLLADKQRLLAQLLACLLLGWNLAQADKLFRSANNLSGDHLERVTFEALQKWFAKRPQDTKNVTFAGLKVSWRNEEGTPCNDEFDFLAFFGRQRQIVQIACKTKLTGKVAAKVREQSQRCFKFLQANLSVTSDWTFVPVTCYSSKDQSLTLCDECSQFVCHPADLGSTLAYIKANEVESCEDLSEYETLVMEFNYRATSNVHLKPWGKKSTRHHDPHRVSLYIAHQIQSNTAEKVIFWNSHQLKALLSNPKVLIIANATFGGGKTEVLKAKAMEVAERHPDDEVLFIVCQRHFRSDLETLLTMRLREDFAEVEEKLKKWKNVKVIEMKDDEDIASQIPETPSSRTHLFIDEVYRGERILKWMENHNLLDPEIRNREDTPYLWVVDMKGWSQELELPEDMIERGLGVNMRNGEEVQRMAKAFAENDFHVSQYQWTIDYVTKCIQRVNAHMKVAGGFALILVSPEDARKENALVKKLKAELNALVYLEDPEDLNDDKERIETFVRDSGSGNPPQEGQSFILITTLHLAEGFECNTVFAQESSSHELSMLHRGVLHHISLNPDLSSIPWEVRKVLFPKDPFLSQDESINQLLFPRIEVKMTLNDPRRRKKTIIPMIEYFATVLKMPLGLDGEAQTAHFYDLVDKVEEDHPGWRDRLDPEQTHWFFIECSSYYPDSCLGAKIVLQDGTSFFVIPFNWYESDITRDFGEGIVPYSLYSRHTSVIEASNHHLPFVIVEIIRRNGQIDDLRFDLARIERIRHRMLKEFRSQKRLPDNLDLTPEDWKAFYLEQVKALQEKPKDAAEFRTFLSPDGEDHEWNALIEAVGYFLLKDFQSWRDDIQNAIEKRLRETKRASKRLYGKSLAEENKLKLIPELATLEENLCSDPPWNDSARLANLKPRAKKLLLQLDRTWIDDLYCNHLTRKKDENTFKARLKLVTILLQDEFPMGFPGQIPGLLDRLNCQEILMEKVDLMSVDPRLWLTCPCHGLRTRFMANYFDECPRQVKFQDYVAWPKLLCWFQTRLSETCHFSLTEEDLRFPEIQFNSIEGKTS